MLFHIISSSETGNTILMWVEYASLFIEILAVGVIVIATIVALGRYLVRRLIQRRATIITINSRSASESPYCWA